MNSEKLGFPIFGRSGQRVASLKEFALELEGWLPLLPVVSLPELTGEMLAGVVRRKGAIAPEGLLDAYIAMIPKTDGDATPLGQRPLGVLPVVYRIWASARMGQLEDWFQSWAPSCLQCWWWWSKLC